MVLIVFLVVRLSEPTKALKPAWMLCFTFKKVVSYPRLYPLFAFDTPQTERHQARATNPCLN